MSRVLRERTPVRRVLGSALGSGLLYGLTLASADPVDLVTGGALGALLAALLDGRLRPPRGAATLPLGSRLAGFPPLVGAILVDIVRGTWDVALRVVHLRALEHPGLVRVPIGDRTERGVAVSALATTLSPGSVLVEVDRERAEMVLHLIDASDPDAARARLQHFYDRYQRRVFP